MLLVFQLSFCKFIHFLLTPPRFDVGKNETELEAYFNVFEHIAIALHWPKEVWPLLHQCKPVGKAQGGCAALTLKDSLVYDRVRSAILKAYELVPEAYRKHFRSLRRPPTQTFLEFAREKGILFDRWSQENGFVDFTS